MLTEASTIQKSLIGALVTAGWKHATADLVPRQDDDVLVEDWVKQAIQALNPQVGTTAQMQMAWNKVMSLVMGTQPGRLFDTNQEFYKFLVDPNSNFMLPDLPAGEQHFYLKLIDFANLSNNRFVVVSGTIPDHEVTFVGKSERRFDAVLYVNGIPLVIIETKSPTEPGVDWSKAASDIVNVYQRECAQMFIPNLLSVATDGRQLRVGSITTPVNRWFPWEDHIDRGQGPFEKCLFQAGQLLAPGHLLGILQHYVMFYKGVRGPQKIVPKPVQIEAVERILTRVEDPTKNQGLVFHSQGSGKTYTMVYAASRISKDWRRFGNPLIMIVIDRRDLQSQTKREFKAVDIGIQEATAVQDLKDKLRGNATGVHVTTVHKFKDTLHTLDRSKAVIMVDEAHRSQDGPLGTALRNAFSNATLIGFTGTPISNEDHNTRDRFGDPSDPDRVLSKYTMSQSIQDGTTLPLCIIPRYVNDQIDKIPLDTEFDEFIDDEELTAEEKAILEDRAAAIRTIFAAPRHIQVVAADIAKHFCNNVNPRGMKAQVVVWDRDLCVKMYDALTMALKSRGKTPAQIEARVVISGSGSKDTPEDWLPHCPDPAEEDRLQRRFNDPDDPFKIVIVCNKWLTGFDAPNEGVIYIDRLLRNQTLFQAVCRTNRPYDDRKRHGLVVDYTTTIKKAMNGALDLFDHGVANSVIDEDTAISRICELLDIILTKFSFVDRTASDGQQIEQAQARYNTRDELGIIPEQLQELHDLWEEIWPNAELVRRHPQCKQNYLWVVKLYQAVCLAFTQGLRDLWTAHGAHTLEIINDHIDASVRGSWPNGVILDQDTIAQMTANTDITTRRLFDQEFIRSAQDVIDHLQQQLTQELANPDCPAIYKSLAERLEALRRMIVETPEEQEAALHALTDITRQFQEAANAPDPRILLDRRIGGMTQILKKYGPEGQGREVLDNVVYKVDGELASGLLYKRWKESESGCKTVKRRIRLILKEYGIWSPGAKSAEELVQKMFDYVQENY